MSGWLPRPLRPHAQALLAWALVLERVQAALGHPQGLAGQALLAGLAGLWLGWPGPGATGVLRRLAQALPHALLLALAASGWQALLQQVLAPALPAGVAAALPWLLLAAVLALDPAAVARVARLVALELLKLATARLVRLGLVASLALTALVGLLHDPLPGETAWTVATRMLGAGFTVAQVFLLVLGAVTFAGEASQGTLKMLLPHAYRRSDWVLAKAAALALCALAFAVGVLLVALGVALLSGPLGDVLLTSEGFGGEPLVTVHATAGTMASHLLDTALAETLALATSACLGLLVSCLVLQVVGALCTAFLFFAALKLADLLLGLSPELLRLLFPWPAGRLREVVGKLGRGLSEGWEPALASHALLLALVTSALCLLLACRSLGRRDLQV